MSFVHDIKAKAYDDIIEKTSSILKQYMSHRPKEFEMADWSKEDIRDMLLELVDHIEYTDYKVGEIIIGAEEEHY